MIKIKELKIKFNREILKWTETEIIIRLKNPNYKTQ